jgi:hypothetical protein
MQLGLHRSHCLVRRLGFLPLGLATGSRRTEPGGLQCAALNYKTKPPGHGPRADDSLPNSWNQLLKGRPSPHLHMRPAPHDSDQPTDQKYQFMKFKIEHSAEAGKLPNNDHELASASCNILRLICRKHPWSSCDTQALHSTFETLRSRRSLHPFPALHHSLPHRHFSPFREYSLPRTPHLAFLCGPRGLAHVTLRAPGAWSRDSPRPPLD